MIVRFCTDLQSTSHPRGLAECPVWQAVSLRDSRFLLLSYLSLCSGCCSSAGSCRDGLEACLYVLANWERLSELIQTLDACTLSGQKAPCSTAVSAIHSCRHSCRWHVACHKKLSQTLKKACLYRPNMPCTDDLLHAFFMIQRERVPYMYHIGWPVLVDCFARTPVCGRCAMHGISFGSPDSHHVSFCRRNQSD